MKNPKSICVVGGGTAGLVAALILKKSYPNLKVDIIESSKIGIIGVGEGSTEHWKTFMDFMNMDKKDMLVSCDATFKAGIMFENWSKEPYLQTVEGAYNLKYHDILPVYAKLIADNKPLTSNETRNSYVVWDNDPQEVLDEFPVVQFHFNTQKLNQYLHRLCQEHRIDVYDDVITDVEITDNGIGKISGDSTYEYDFYIDSTGFSRALIDKLGAKWNSYSDYLKMNSAIVFPTENEERFPMWTLARAMDAGWMFRIPVWGRNGNGYIFDKNYITPEQAKAEVEEYLGHEVEVAKHLEFDPGCVDKTWIKNCVAIGLSGSFVEPLEATSIGTSIQQAFLLANRIVNYNDRTIELYNQEVEDILLDIRDFVALHYVVDREDTDFWRDVKKMPLPPRLEKNMEMWKHKLPQDGDFGNESSYRLFSSPHYTLILAGNNQFDINSIREQYEMLPRDVKELTERTIVENSELPPYAKKVSHKTIIDLIRQIA
jgi:flavin-dependent dehydrogenase